MKVLSILTLLLNLSIFRSEVVINQPPLQDIEKNDPAKRKLIIFSGSDWCKGCIQLQKEVLSSDVFKEFTNNNIEVVTADFPQRTRLPQDVVAKNEALAEKYNPDGQFPRLVLLSPDESEAQIITYRNQGPQAFVNELKTYLTR